MHLGIVDADGLQIPVFHRIGGDLRIVKTALDLQRLVHLGVHAHAQPHPVLGHVLAGEALGDLVQDAPVILPVGTVDQEGVRPAAASHASHLPGDLTDPIADPGKHAVAVLLPIALIEHMEMIHVQHNGVHGHFRILLVV